MAREQAITFASEAIDLDKGEIPVPTDLEDEARSNMAEAAKSDSFRFFIGL